MKVLVLTLALVGFTLAMPVGVEQDHPRPVVPLVITDYSSVASKTNPEDKPQEVPKESSPAAEESKPEENPAAPEDKPETPPAPAPAPTADETKPADDALVEKASTIATENQEAVNNNPKPAEVPLQEEKVPAAESDAVSDKKEEPIPTSEVEASSSQDAPVVKPEDAKVSDEINPIAPVALNAPKISEKAEESDSSETKPAEETKEEQQADEKNVKTEIKPAESELPAAVTDPAEEKPLEKVEEQTAVEEAKKPEAAEEPAKDEAQESPVINRRKRGTDGKEDEKKKPTELTKKEKDEKKAKSDDIPVKNVEVNVEEVKAQETGPSTLEDPKPEEAASEVKPVELPKPTEDIPEAKPEVPVNPEAAPSTVPEVNSDNSQNPAQVDENKNVEASGEKKLEVPKVEEEKIEKAENTPQETKIVPEAVEKDVEKTSDEAVQVEGKKTEEASVSEEKKEVSSDEVSSDPVVEKQEGQAPATIKAETAEKTPEPAADEKQPENKEEGVNVAESASS